MNVVRTESELSLNSRSRLFGSSDHDTLIREGIIPSPKVNEFAANPKLKQLKNYFSNNTFLDDEWHSEEYLHVGYEELKSSDSSWRLREKMRTVGVALVVCLNIGIDPPDLFKPNPCAKKECWFDPSGQKQKGLEYIGNALQQQYEKWQAKAKYKQCLDPTSDDLRRVCMNLRKGSRSDRLLLHYNGHGVPKPTKNGELWVFGKHYTHYTPVAICELRSWLGDPAIYVLDCSAAGLLIPHLVDNMNLKDSDLNASYDSEQVHHGHHGGHHHNSASLRENTSNFSLLSQGGPSDSATIVLAACKGNEQLPFHPMYPVDIFTSCLTTPTTIAIRWFILQNPYSMHGVNPDIAESIPGKDNDRKTPRGELNWILTAITDTIAWNTLPSSCFKKMFRKDLLVASLFRNFLLAKRIMKSFGCTPQSWPPMPDSTTHALWQSWDMALESFLTHYVSLQKGSGLVDYRNNIPFVMPSNISFFNDQLSAFEMWLEFGTANSAPPPQLPVVLQVLLSQSHRMRALLLLKKFLSLGPEAIKLSLILGIFPYILKLLQNPADDIKQTLISIWATVIGFDSSCRQELVREKSQLCFIQVLGSKVIPAPQRCLASFVLAEVCNGYKEGQQSCLQLGLHRTCTTIILQSEVVNTSTLKLWVCLCLYKLCEDFLWAKYLCITEAGHTALYPLLIDPDPTVRTAAVLALGELFGASTLTKNANPVTPSFDTANPTTSNSSGLGGMTPGSARPMRKTLSTSSDDLTAHAIVEEKLLEESELQLALQILECCTDGSVMVRLEAVYALSKFFTQPTHLDCIKLVAKSIYIKTMEKQKQSSGTSTSASMSYANARRSASPGLENNFGKVGMIYPWHLTPQESLEITTQLEAFIKVQHNLIDQQPAVPINLLSTSQGTAGAGNAGPGGGGVGTGASPGMHRLSPIQVPQSMPTVTNQTAAGSFPQTRTLFSTTPDATNKQPQPGSGSSDGPLNESEEKSGSPTPELATLMASAYIRLWLALTEVQGRDPHSLVAQAAATIRFRIHALIAIDERNQYTQIRSGGNPGNSQQSMNMDLSTASYGNMDSMAQQFLSAASTGSYSPSTSASNNYATTLNLVEKKLKKTMTNDSLINDYFQNRSSPVMMNGTGDDNTPNNNDNSNSNYSPSAGPPQLSPLGVVATGTIYASPKSVKAKNVKFGAKIPKSSPFLTQPENQFDTSSTSPIPGSSGAVIYSNPNNNSNMSGIAYHKTPGGPKAKYYFLEAFKDYAHLTEDDLLICFSSNHYEMMKKQYMDAKAADYDPYQDPLSLESNDRSFRLQRLQDLLQHERLLSETFKDVEDRPEMILERKNKLSLYNNDLSMSLNASNLAATTAALTAATNAGSGGGGGGGTLPPNTCKFEQKSTLRMDSPMTTSLIMFHAFQDILVVASESTANIWSLQNHQRIVEVKNRHTLKRDGQERNGYEVGAHTPTRSTRLPQVVTQENSLFTPLNTARITSMTWINESYDPLLLLGSDDGVVKVWKDISFSDPSSHNHTTSSNNAAAATPLQRQNSSGDYVSGTASSPGSYYPSNSGVELSTAFSALPDIAETSRGSGIVLSWQQTAGTLVVGGNSNTIRVWDLGREQNVRVFYTGVETCLTAMATNTVSNGFSNNTNFNTLSDSNYFQSSEMENIPVTWTFAGFADGSIAVYDERVHSNGGRVHYSHSHGNWVNYAHLRADVPEVVIGSVRGTVKFWDLRTLRTYKTLEVQKSPLTSLTVHNCAPILAAGSHAQFIKILTLSGEQLGNVIKYYDGFLGQRIGPVSCLAFHPHKLLLGASSTDGIVSIYHAAIEKLN